MADTQNKAEKKARKELAKLGLKPVDDVVAVTLKKAPNSVFTVQNPEVFKSSGGGVETFAVYGQIKVEDAAGSSQSSSRRGAPSARSRPAPKAYTAPAAAEASSEEEAGDAASDLEGLSEKDVQMVISQVGVDRAKAIATLKKNGGDIINSIMDLTM